VKGRKEEEKMRRMFVSGAGCRGHPSRLRVTNKGRLGLSHKCPHTPVADGQKGFGEENAGHIKPQNIGEGGKKPV